MSEGNRPQQAASIKIRRVTDFHADFEEPGSADQPGTFFFQFILDDGADEHVMRPHVDDGRLLYNLITAAETLYFDTERKRLIMRDVD